MKKMCESEILMVRENQIISLKKLLKRAEDKINHIMQERDMAITMLADWAIAIKEENHEEHGEHWANVWCVETRKFLITPLLKKEYGKARSANKECRHCGVSMIVRKDCCLDEAWCQNCVDCGVTPTHIDQGADTAYKVGIGE